MPINIKSGYVSLIQNSFIPKAWGHLGGNISANIQQLENRLNVITARQGDTQRATPYFSTQYEFTAVWPLEKSILLCIEKDNLPSGHYTDLTARGWIAFGDSSGEGYNRFLCYNIWDASATEASSDITKYTDMEHVIVWNDQSGLSFRNLSGYYDWTVDSATCDINSKQLYNDVNTVFGGRYWNRAVVVDARTGTGTALDPYVYTYKQVKREGNTWIKMTAASMLDVLEGYPTANIGLDPYVTKRSDVYSDFVNKGALGTGTTKHNVIAGIPIGTIKYEEKLVWNMRFLDNLTYRIYLSKTPYTTEPTDANSIEISPGKYYFEFTGTNGKLEYTSTFSGETNLWMKWCVMDGGTRKVGGTLVLPSEGDLQLIAE